MHRPLLLPLSFAVAGMAAGGLYGLTPAVWTLAALLAALLAASCTRGSVPFLLALAAVSFDWGALFLARQVGFDPAWRRFATEEPVTVQGTVARRVEGTGSGSRIYLRVERLTGGGVSGTVRELLLVHVGEGRAPYATGDRLLLRTRIRKPRPYGLPGERDYRSYLAFKGVGATAFVKDCGELVLLREGEGVQHALDTAAASLGRFIVEAAPGEEGGILKALLIGDTGDVPPELNDAYARSGVNHILSISGFHVGILFIAIFQLLFLAGRSCEWLALRLNLRREILLAALPVTVLYLFLSGAASATVRSVLMIVFVAAALYLKREVDPVHLIVLSACAILAVAPQSLFDISFQLSFLAIWGMVVLTPLLVRPCARAPGRVKALVALLGATAAAILATAVPVACYFGRVSFTGLVCNLAVIPLMGYGAVVAGFTALLFSSLCPPIARGLVIVAAHLVRLSDRAILLCAKVPVITSYHPGRLDLLCACLLLAALTLLTQRRARLFCALPLCALLAVGAVPRQPPADGDLHVTFLSVGQGDAALVRLPDGKTMLVDGGGSAGDREARVGERLLVPALQSLGVRRVDYLVLSHPHPDHFQGLTAVATAFEVGEFWETGATSELRDFQELKWVLAAQGVPVRELSAATPPLAVGGAQVETLWPPRGAARAADDANDVSLVFRLTLGRSSVLFTGDLGEEQELELVRRRAPLACSLLKVGHHGSRYSTCAPFLAACAPTGAVISAGYGNSFHLPAPSTVQRLMRRGVRVYRTDREGSVEALLKGDGSCLLSTPWEGAF